MPLFTPAINHGEQLAHFLIIKHTQNHTKYYDEVTRRNSLIRNDTNHVGTPCEIRIWMRIVLGDEGCCELYLLGVLWACNDGGSSCSSNMCETTTKT
jgi:hypothetical protein